MTAVHRDLFNTCCFTEVTVSTCISNVCSRKIFLPDSVNSPVLKCVIFLPDSVKMDTTCPKINPSWKDVVCMYDRFVMVVTLTCGRAALANLFKRCFIVPLMRTRMTLHAFSYDSECLHTLCCHGRLLCN